MKAKTESQIQREVCDLLASHEIFFWRSNNIAAPGRAMPKYSLKGVPDILIVRRGVLIGIEVKRPADDIAREANGRTVRGGKQSIDQISFEKQLKENGGVYILVHSLDEAKEKLHDHYVVI